MNGTHSDIRRKRRVSFERRRSNLKQSQWHRAMKGRRDRTFDIPLGRVLELREGERVAVRTCACNGEVPLACGNKEGTRSVDTMNMCWGQWIREDGKRVRGGEMMGR